MKKIFYSDNCGIYRLLDYDQSHSQLLLRKHKSSTEEKNIDILFKGVYSLNITIIYKGITISVTDRKEGQTINNLSNRNFIFELTDGSGLISYIDASAVGIFNNKLDYSISSLGEFTWSPENELKSWITEDDWTKIVNS